jgi:hypothetical protein
VLREWPRGYLHLVLNARRRSKLRRIDGFFNGGIGGGPRGTTVPGFNFPRSMLIARFPPHPLARMASSRAGSASNASLGYGNYNAAFVSFKTNNWHGLTTQQDSRGAKRWGPGRLCRPPASSRRMIPSIWERCMAGSHSITRRYTTCLSCTSLRCSRENTGSPDTAGRLELFSDFYGRKWCAALLQHELGFTGVRSGGRGQLLRPRAVHLLKESWHAVDPHNPQSERDGIGELFRESSSRG